MELPLTQSFQFSQPRTTTTSGGRKRKLAVGVRKSKRAKLVSIPRPRFTSRALPSAFPQKKRVTLTYVENISNTPSVTGAANGTTFRLNGPYDPNLTGAGHQPMAWDQWTPFYNKYTVLSAKIHVQAASIDGQIKAGYVGVVPYSQLLTSSTDVPSLMEEGDAVYGLIPGDSSAVSISRSIDMGKYFSITNPLEDDTLQAPTTSLPSRTLQAYVWTAVAAGTATAGGLITISVRITYDVVFTEPKELASS